MGFLSFLRLIGMLYFKRHISPMASLKNIEIPQFLIYSFNRAVNENLWLGITQSGALCVKGFQMKEMGYHHTHQCGITGFVAVGWGSCGADFHNRIYTNSYMCVV